MFELENSGRKPKQDYLPPPAGGSMKLTLKPMSPFLQQRQANMRKTKVKRPEKETATTAIEEGQDSSLRGAPSATKEDKGREDELRQLTARSCRRSKQKTTVYTDTDCFLAFSLSA